MATWKTAHARNLIILLGLVSLFADMTYEGARSITGQYLAILGASGALVGFVSGLGEFFGYTLRFVFGYLTDKTGRYWLFTFIGYTLNLIAVPLLAFAENWQMAATLIVLERFGKAVRSPSRDAMISFAANVTGRGWGFGLHEALDQMGAIFGPLLISFALFIKMGYQESFLLLAIPALIALCILIITRILYLHPQELEPTTTLPEASVFSSNYFLYMLASGLVALGFIDFPLIAFHLEKQSLLPTVWMPLLFSLAMAFDGVAGLILGRWYDKKGIIALVIATLITALFPLFVFQDNPVWIFLGIILWGVGLGSQETIMRALVADLVRPEVRATSFGLFNLSFGVFWFIGSVICGQLYDLSIPLLMAFSCLAQLLAVPLMWKLKKQ